MVWTFEKVIEGDFVKICRTGEGGDVATHGAVGFVCLHHHGHGVPTHHAGDSLFDCQITGVCGLVLQ